VADASGGTKAIWFNQAWLLERLRPGTRLLLSGKLDRATFKVSAHEIIGADGLREQGIHTVGLVPVHSVTDGLSADRVREWVWSSAGFSRDAIEALPRGRAARGAARTRWRADPGLDRVAAFRADGGPAPSVRRDR
jgi:RecG-like helicase